MKLMRGAVLGLLLISCGEDTPELVISTGALPDVRLSENYDQKIEVTGGLAPYVFNISAGALPDGITLGAETGQLTGASGTPGRSMFTVSVSGSSDKTATKALEIYVVPEALEIVTTQLPGGKEGEAYDQSLIGRGGIAPLVWSTPQGSLPAGLTLSEAGQISGTPTEFGDFDFMVTLADAEGTERQQTLSLSIISAAPQVSTMMLPAGRVGELYEQTLEGVGGVPPYTWAVTQGTLPMGLALAADGTLAGAPEEAGGFSFTVQIADSTSAQTEMVLMLEVVAPLQIDTPGLPSFVIDRPQTFQLQASGGVPAYAWSIGSGDLPAGVTLVEDGTLSGMTSDTGDFQVTVRVRDSEGFQKSALFTLTVSDRFIFTVEPGMNFPSTCTATTVSYVTVPIEVPQSMQISDLNIAVDFDYMREDNGNAADNGRLKIELIGPHGQNAMLCGNGANIPGGVDCEGSGGLNEAFDDDGGQASRPARPLFVFDGTNAQGQWLLRIGVVSGVDWSFGNRIPQNMCPQNPQVGCRSGPAPTPSDEACGRIGTINSVTLSIQDERSTDDYVMVQGWFQNNLVTNPYVRLGGGGLDHHRLNLRATAYSVGPNGFAEGGMGDDVAQPAQLLWDWQGAPIPFVEVTPDGRVTAGEGDENMNGIPDQRTGDGMLVAAGGGYVVSVPIFVTPPIWNTMRRQF